MSLYTKESLIKSLQEIAGISQDKLDELVGESDSKNIPLEELLVSENYVSDEELGKIVADLASLPFIKLSEVVIDKEVLNIIPQIVAKKQHIISFAKDKNGLSIATSDPENTQIVSFLEKKTGIPVVLFYATKVDIEEALRLYVKDIIRAYDEIISESIQSAKNATKKDPSIVKIVDTTIMYAYQNKASDIHIEPNEKGSLIRFRIDGILHDIVELPKDLHEQIVTRVKVLAKLRTDKHLAPQDGKIVQKMEGENLDIRLSVVPVSGGEKVVMRLLAENSREFSLADLGLAKKDLKKVENAYKKPHGMILATGPTGSGKTTTLYAILKLVNSRDVNIMTIEDPVEYEVQGVNQIQVNERTNLTFANGLRSIVRQDPDIILVGEIRDKETADISINAAMTGHLLLSTLHTNDAATSIPRLMDLGVEPFLVSSTVNVIIAQRLVRKICTKCRYSTDLDLSEKDGGFVQDLPENETLPMQIIKKYYPKREKIRVYRGKGCGVCHHTGYTGRVGIFEVMLIDEAIREAISQRRDAATIQKIATDAGMTSMFSDGIEKVNQGITSLEEILRVTKE